MNKIIVLPKFAKTKLHVIYLLAGNLDLVIPFDLFSEIIPSMDTRQCISTYINQLKGYFQANGLIVESVRFVGYRCRKVEE